MFGARVRLLMLMPAVLPLFACGETPLEPAPAVGAGRILYVADEASWPGQRLVVATEQGTNESITGVLRGQIRFDWSAANELIAYVSASGPGIRIIRSDGSVVRSAAEHLQAHDILDLQWSPDGTRLLFHGGDGIYVLPAGGGTPLRIAGNTDWYASPSWSPDGREVAFARQGSPPEFRYELWIVRADASQERRVPLPIGVSNPRWSPDGQRIAFDNSQLFVVGTDGTGLHVMAGDCAPGDACGSEAMVQHPRWSPDGKRIAAIQAGSVVLIEVETRGTLRIAAGEVTNPAPRWSLDGTRVAFVGSTEDVPTAIHSASVDGGDVVKVTASARNEDIPVWIR